MIRELELRRKSPRTVEAYVTAVAQLASHYRRSPEAISVEEVRDFLHYLITQRKVAFSTCNQKLAGIQFFYREVLGQRDFSLRVPAKRGGRLPEPLSRSEITRILEAAGNLRHRVLLMTELAEAGSRRRWLRCLRRRPWVVYSPGSVCRSAQAAGLPPWVGRRSAPRHALAVPPDHFRASIPDRILPAPPQSHRPAHPVSPGDAPQVIVTPLPAR